MTAPTAPPLVLASGSEVRARLLRNAGLLFEVQSARVDEEALRQAAEAEAIPPRDVADHLAELKAARVAAKRPEALVLGCDQILDIDGRILTKPETPAAARDQLAELSGRSHTLHSAAVLHAGGRAVWRHVARARLTMRPLSEGYIDSYVARNWPAIGACVGAYMLEAEGVRLFTRIDGDFFTVLGLPLLPLLDHLAAMGMIET
ncbi:nucleoside triphosphate pyrophosphatase [Tropicimonas sp. IMCC34043]|uniref:Maf family protein n=1 Tax=Tropicimonas sp. IMCC34043 TaxID=2248760 RepID=UPI000E27B1B3|nr:Maf family protein [Tropicimonas sp. IMCC34043]